MNNIIISGRLTKKPELKQTQKGKNICEFTIAVNRGIKDNNGNYISDFISCRCWNYLAENLNKYQDKGDYVIVQGKLQVDNYTDKDNKQKYITYVLAENIEFTPKKKTDPVNNIVEPEKEDILNPKNIQITDEDLPFYG